LQREADKKEAERL